MKKFKIISVPVLIVAVAVIFAVVPAFAEHGGRSSGSDDGTSSGQTAEAGDDSSGGGSTGDNNNDTNTADDSGNDGAGHEKGLATAGSHGHKSAQAREHLCESHKHGLETKFTRITINSQRIEDRISDVLNEAMTYQQDKNLKIDNFDSLVSQAQSAKTNADTAIANLKGVTPTVDCNSVSVASDVATFKNAASETRDSLKAYRSAVKDVIKALLDAKQQSDSSGASGGAEGSDQ